MERERKAPFQVSDRKQVWVDIDTDNADLSPLKIFRNICEVALEKFYDKKEKEKSKKERKNNRRKDFFCFLFV